MYTGDRLLKDLLVAKKYIYPRGAILGNGRYVHRVQQLVCIAYLCMLTFIVRMILDMHMFHMYSQFSPIIF